MIRKVITVFAVGVLLFLCWRQTAAAVAVRIGFDTAPDGSAIPSGTPVNSLFSSWGVTFDLVRCPSCAADPNVYAVGSCRGYLPYSVPNMVSMWNDGNCTPLTERLGVVQANFAAPVDSVCLLVMPVRLGDQAVLRAYDSAGIEIATAYSTPSATETVCIAAPGIVRVSFGGAYLGYAWFDDLFARVAAVTPAARRSWGELKTIYR